MRTTINIWLCKLITFVCKLFKKTGSVYPGSIIYKLDKKALWKLKYPSNVIVITGSSGKGSTTSMLAHILTNSGMKVVWNKNGSNINNAVMTLILNNSSALTHKVQADAVLLEMDERYIKNVFAPGTIKYLAITNITRDQPARNRHVDLIYDAIMSSVDSSIHLVLNADDPVVNRASFEHSGDISKYGIEKTIYDTMSTPPYAVDAAYCPKCNTKLKYEFYHYGHLGEYECPNCDFKRGKVDFKASDVDLKNSVFKINGIEFKLNKGMFFAVYYTLLAYSLAKLVGLSIEQIKKSINDDMMPSKRGKTFYLNGRPVEMLESKNENALSYLQSLNYIKNKDGKKTVILGFENVSRRYNFNDLSWLWDVDFELLKDDNIDKIFCIGRFKYDVAVRLDYADIDRNKVVLVDDIKTLIDRVNQESSGDIYTMVCFDMTEMITNMLREWNNEKEGN